MIRITKIFYFEMAHALHGYNGACRHIHGHSYELHVTIASVKGEDTYLQSPGFIIDFKELKKIINLAVIEKFDHKLVLSQAYLSKFPAVMLQENLEILEVEPSVENLLLFSRKAICKVLPPLLSLQGLKLYETRDSYAEWLASIN
ncbi:6-pyruvoyl trahydropterin synthase family protein [Mucilaginibacter ginsenosidivorans]|uniref:6-carboxy-5,6,7,8-tetrahydropterin synthase n=1 Tax=Mucilaginibacter ginsenosidivorans TaxID=398053 RepID=A0A5B8UUC1_9SPHI|nr:6-carboxytetrahydropterin synthase [Mucilaginibacter ginsenosidivorans]QEC62355.1 6-carboxytetrahydropterin synthase [Mucilaginibacter ginsenosidivorans]